MLRTTQALLASLGVFAHFQVVPVPNRTEDMQHVSLFSQRSRIGPCGVLRSVVIVEIYIYTAQHLGIRYDWRLGSSKIRQPLARGAGTGHSALL